LEVETRITEKPAARFALAHLEVRNESAGHNVPAGSETHFKVTLVADEFAGVGRLARHRAVNETLADELAGGVHALAVHTYTPGEWRARFGASPMSPPCLGGGARSGAGRS